MGLALNDDCSLKARGRASIVCFLVIIFGMKGAIYPVAKSAPTAPPSFVVTIGVDERGDANVVMNFTAYGSGEFATFVPVTQNVTFRYEGGSFVIAGTEAVGFFYNQTRFDYQSNGDEAVNMIMSFFFSHASLYSGSSAWFMSPMLGSNTTDVTVVVTFTNFAGIAESEPTPVTVDRSTVTFSLPLNTDYQRVALNYNLAKPFPSVNVTREIMGSQVRITTDSIYEDVANQVLDVMERAYENLTFVFGDIAPQVDFQFYLPKRLDLGTLGYVSGEDVNLGTGPININLALVRFKPGYTEQVTLHEYTHLGVGRVGVIATGELRWFHEGMAEYVSGEICKSLGIPTDVDDYLTVYQSYIQQYGSDLSFIEDWKDDPQVADIYYAMSYYIIRTLGDEHGGLSFYRSVLAEIKSAGGASDLQSIVRAMSLAAKVDLSGTFRDWGFNVEAVEIPVLPSPIEVWPIIAIWATLIIALVAIALVIRPRPLEELPPPP